MKLCTYKETTIMIDLLHQKNQFVTKSRNLYYLIQNVIEMLMIMIF
jgi:hypothetical protein